MYLYLYFFFGSHIKQTQWVNFRRIKINYTMNNINNDIINNFEKNKNRNYMSLLNLNTTNFINFKIKIIK